MNCRELERLLEDFLGGNLTADLNQAAAEHVAVCPACAELISLVKKNRDALVEVDGPELTTAILDRTSGSPCGRAQELLSDLVQDRLAGDDSFLVRQHLQHCRECAALEQTLAWLVPLLPSLGQVEPDPSFTTAVLGATSRRRFPRPTLDELGERWRAWWQGVLARPRFALEAAYIGTMLVVLLCGTPLSPLREVPTRALQLVQAGPTQMVSVFSPDSPTLLGELGRLGDSAWQATGGRADQAARRLGAGLQSRWQRTRTARDGLRDHSRQLGRSVLSLDLVGTTLQLRAMGNDCRNLWRSWRGDAEINGGPKKNHAASEPAGADSRQSVQE